MARSAPGVNVADSKPRDNRAAILEAAARTIARRGVRGLRVEDVAAAAGVSAPLLYYHFESRSGLVKAALEAASEQAPSTALRDEPQAGRTGFEALEAALLAELDDSETIRDNAVVWGEVSASAVFEPELREDVRRVTETWRAEVAEGIRAGIADSSIDSGVDPEDTAELLITITDGFINRWLAGTIDLPRARELLSSELRARLLR